MDGPSYSIGQYLVDRLRELGIRHLFALPGSHCTRWLHSVVAETPSFRYFGTTNPTNAGYAADGYARMKGLSAVCVPYSVGTSLLPPLAGAYAERVPIVAVNGAPPDRSSPARRRPIVGGRDANLRAFRGVTCAAERLPCAGDAPDQIDRVLRRCRCERRPVYLEPRADVLSRPCPPPRTPLSGPEPATVPPLLVERIVDRLRRADSVVVWAGAELQRYGLEASFERLVRILDAPYVTSLLGKGLLPEDHPLFGGVYVPGESASGVRSLLADADYVLGLGVGPTCTAYAPLQPLSGVVTLVHRDGLRSRPDGDAFSLPEETPLNLGALLSRLCESAAGLPSLGGTKNAARTRASVHRARSGASLPADGDITYQGFYDLIEQYVGDDTILVSGPGLDRFGAQSLPLSRASGFLCQAVYGDLGHPTPAAIGADLATDADRIMVCVSDEEFQRTAQCVGTMAEMSINALIFVLNTGVRGTVQWRTEPAPFIRDAPFFPQSLLQHWHYRDLPAAFGGRGWRADTYGRLRSVIEKAFKYTGGPLLVDVRVQQKSLPDLAAHTLDLPRRDVGPPTDASLSPSQ